MDARALMLRQPWASLVAVGAKTIIDQAKPTSYRGGLLIHAGARRPEYGLFREFLCEEFYNPVRHVKDCDCEEDGVAPECARRSPSTMKLSPVTGVPIDLPLGAVVASAQLIDCVEIVGYGQHGNYGDHSASHRTRIARVCDYPHEGELPHQQGGLWITGQTALTLGSPTRVEHERPFGDFTPGRWAWLLEDVKPTTERCPRCWGGGDNPEWPRSYPTSGPCLTCVGLNRCEPVPMRGRPGLWTPEWESA